MESTSAERNRSPLNIERFQLAVVSTKTLLVHEFCNIWVGLPTGFKKTYESTLLLMLLRGFLTPCPASPAVEVHLIAPQVNVAIGEHRADFFKELGHEGIGGVQDGVHRSKGARKL